jgi:tetratricopeptide (TPR) repeat protein
MTGLPLRLRLRRALLIALLLGLWAPAKLVWERHIVLEQNELRYQGLVLTRHLRDQLGQGLTIGVLSGMRNVVADFVWFEVTGAWENQEWFRMGALVNLCTVLQPRYVTFWDLGAWQLAWNASVAATNDLSLPNQLRRAKASRYWINQGLAIFKRGIENNPESWKLWADTGWLYQARLNDYRTAAYYYGEALKRPNCPTFYERFPAIMYGHGFANDDRASYEAWKALWYRLTPAQRAEPRHRSDKIEQEIRSVEQKLSIPKEKRVFPN